MPLSTALVRLLSTLAVVMLTLFSAAASVAASAADTVVIIDGDTLGRYNPILGHGRNGDSHIYQGLYRVETGVFTTQPKLVPVLASGPAVASKRNTVWRVPLRSGVTFSNGASFGAADVVATYRALLDPRSASSEIAAWDNLEKVTADGANVVFHLKEPMADFDRRLINVIAPASAFDFAHLGRAEQASLNHHPIGTGPYALTSLRPDQAIFEARDDYWGAAPAVRRIVVRYTADDNARAQQIRAGEGDGTLLAGELAATFKAPEYEVLSVKSADWRGITLPAAHPVAGDDAVRLAVNYAVDRKGMVKDVLKGNGVANSTFLAGFYGNAYDPAEEFAFDLERARQILDKAGWKVGQDGIRVRDGQRASFKVIYFPNRDRARRDLTLATASALKKVGIEVIPEARDSGSINAEDYRTTPIMLGGGGIPYSVDGQIYHILHSKYANSSTGAIWDNGSDYRNPSIDKLLDQARAEPSAAKRAALYRQVQKAYHAKPAMLQLAYINHVYVKRNQGYRHDDALLEPHTHGVNFGPWYAIEDWTRDK
ncbi:ABC transporter substrate-binding protein [Carnimonas bestiolae]|uniref:ABC transporter substrate-binding protein n=1 Tax=Carnimonas bestiolae TaxID=3402172 RepID=UPI003EDC689A